MFISKCFILARTLFELLLFLARVTLDVLHVCKYRQASRSRKTSISWSITRTDRIVILGAGFSAIHMAQELVKRGYKNVTLLERSDRCSGKVLTVSNAYSSNLNIDVGACYLSSDYDNIRYLLDEYGISYSDTCSSRHIHKSAAESWTGPNAIRDWIHSTKSYMSFISEWCRYWIIHKRLWTGFCKHGCFPEDEAVHRRIDCAFGVFLEKHNLGLIKKFAALHLSQMGYGIADYIPTYYGFYWMSPESVFLHAFKITKLQIVKDGFETLCKKIVDKYDLRIKYSSEIKNIDYENGEHVIHYDQGMQQHILSCKLLISAIPLNSSLRYFPQEQREFGRAPQIHSRFVVHTLKITSAVNKEVPFTSFVDNLYYDQVKPWSRLRVLSLRNQDKLRVNENDRECDLGVLYSFIQEDSDGNVEAPAMPMKEDYKERTLSLCPLPVCEDDLLEQFTWPYHYRWTLSGLRGGWPQKVMRYNKSMQRNLLFIGGSVCFESLNNILDYNLQVLDRLDAAGEGRSRSDTCVDGRRE